VAKFDRRRIGDDPGGNLGRQAAAQNAEVAPQVRARRFFVFIRPERESNRVARLGPARELGDALDFVAAVSALPFRPMPGVPSDDEPCS
jgi:hypothetical protein